MTTLIIIIFVLQFLVMSAAIFFSARTDGQNVLLKKMLVESRWREKRLQFEIKLWQDKVVQRLGAGKIHNRWEKIATEPGARLPESVRRVVSPSEAITRQMQKDAENPSIKQQVVPPRIKQEFLEESANIVFTDK